MSGRHRSIYIALQIGLLAAFLIAAFAFHASGTTLVILRVARIVLVVAFIVVARQLGRRRARRSPVADDTAASD